MPKSRRARTIRAYLCQACGHIFKTVKRPQMCNKCGGKLTLLDRYKEHKPKLGRRRWITPEDFYEKGGESVMVVGKAVFKCPMDGREVVLHRDCTRCERFRHWGMNGARPYVSCGPTTEA